MVRWAKAPDFADQPARQAEVRAQTVVDKQRYLEQGQKPRRCEGGHSHEVEGQTNPHPTTRQWSAPPPTPAP
ncbi:hypothetical protein, partial [Nocardia brasiliensis]|uniref:hypothetical protein n=1 Tax=Nocardia brasiliensis TaxID=37326 RepID=UPI0024538EA9